MQFQNAPCLLFTNRLGVGIFSQTPPLLRTADRGTMRIYLDEHPLLLRDPLWINMECCALLEVTSGSIQTPRHLGFHIDNSCDFWRCCLCEPVFTGALTVVHGDRINNSTSSQVSGGAAVSRAGRFLSQPHQSQALGTRPSGTW